jgi:hypothetical protein
MADEPQAAADASPRTLWFSPPGVAESPRRTVNEQRVQDTTPSSPASKLPGGETAGSDGDVQRRQRDRGSPHT